MTYRLPPRVPKLITLALENGWDARAYPDDSGPGQTLEVDFRRDGEWMEAAWHLTATGSALAHCTYRRFTAHAWGPPADCLLRDVPSILRGGS